MLLFPTVYMCYYDPFMENTIISLEIIVKGSLYFFKVDLYFYMWLLCYMDYGFLLVHGDQFYMPRSRMNFLNQCYRFTFVFFHNWKFGRE